jgi:hypothetical protein
MVAGTSRLIELGAADLNLGVSTFSQPLGVTRRLITCSTTRGAMRTSCRHAGKCEINTQPACRMQTRRPAVAARPYHTPAQLHNTAKLFSSVVQVQTGNEQPRGGRNLAFAVRACRPIHVRVCQTVPEANQAVTEELCFINSVQMPRNRVHALQTRNSPRPQQHFARSRENGVRWRPRVDRAFQDRSRDFRMETATVKVLNQCRCFAGPHGARKHVEKQGHAPPRDILPKNSQTRQFEERQKIQRREQGKGACNKRQKRLNLTAKQEMVMQSLMGPTMFSSLPMRVCSCRSQEETQQTHRYEHNELLRVRRKPTGRPFKKPETRKMTLHNPFPGSTLSRHWRYKANTAYL